MEEVQRQEEKMEEGRRRRCRRRRSRRRRCKQTMEAVMKKFHGRSVPKPSMKKISHTDLYLAGGKKERWSDRQVGRQTGGQTDDSNVIVVLGAGTVIL